MPFYLFDVVNAENESSDNGKSLNIAVLGNPPSTPIDNNNKFWLKEWGPKPEKIDEAVSKCIDEYNKVPKLLPVYSHR